MVSSRQKIVRNKENDIWLANLMTESEREETRDSISTYEPPAKFGIKEFLDTKELDMA